MNTVMFNYDQQMASQIGGGLPYKSGGYDLKIVRAQFKDGKFLEFDFEEKEGRKFQYVSVNYQKNDGQPNEYGWKMINAIMGCIGVNQLSCDQNGMCHELNGKFIKGVLQRIDRVRTQGVNVGKEYFEFDFKLPANIKTGQTVKEMLENKPAEAFAKYAETIEDKDERGEHKQQASYAGGVNHGGYQPQHNDPSTNFDDEEFPF